MFDGVRPIIRLASAPTASGRPSLMSTATTEGSFSTMPAAADVDQRVGGAEVDGHVTAKEGKAVFGHSWNSPEGLRMGTGGTGALVVRPQATGRAMVSQGGRPATAV